MTVMLHPTTVGGAKFSNVTIKWFKMKWKTGLWSDEPKSKILFGNHELCVILAIKAKNVQLVISTDLGSYHYINNGMGVP